MEILMLLRRPHDLAALIRDGRARAGWSQTELAERVGVSRQWVSLVENGKTSVELDLAMETLRTLGYSIYVKSTAPGDRPATGQGYGASSGGQNPQSRTPLTRHGRPLGKVGAKRRSQSSTNLKASRE